MSVILTLGYAGDAPILVFPAAELPAAVITVVGTQGPNITAATLAPATLTGSWTRLSSLVRIEARVGKPVLSFSVTDGLASAGSVQLWYAGNTLSQGATLTLGASVSLDDVWVFGGTVVGVNQFTVTATDQDGSSSLTGLAVGTRASNAAPTLAVSSINARVLDLFGVRMAVAAQAFDADGDTPVLYRFWDSAGGGHLALSGIEQASGQNIEITAADLPYLNYVAGASSGVETLWAQVYDGIAWSAWTSWSQRSVRDNNSLPVVSAANRNLGTGQWIRASDLDITVYDADGDAPHRYRFTDLNVNGTSAHMWMGGSDKPQGDIVTINAADLGNLWIQGGTANALDGFTVEIDDGYDWSNAATFDFITRPPNRAPVVAGSGATVAVNATAAATSLVSVTDADGDTPTLYRFWDPAGGGVFKLSGVTQASGQNLDVAAADIANLTYAGGATAGRETLWAQVYDGQAWSAWTSWSQQTVRNTNTLSVVGAANRNLTTGQWIRANELTIAVTDADSDAPAQYRFTDGTATAGSVQLWMGGNFVAQGGGVTVNAADLANLWIQGGTANGSDAFTVEVNDGFGWSNAAAFNLVTRAPNRAPVVAGAGATVTVGNSVAAASLIRVTDADGDTPTLYRFWDPAGGGVFKLSGVAQASGQNLDIAAVDIGNLRYFGGTPAGRETLWAQVYDGQAWSAWTSWSQQTLRNSNTPSVVNAPQVRITSGQWLRATELGFLVSDADGDSPQQYRLTDGNSALASARMWFGGNFVSQGSTVSVDAAELVNLWVQAGTIFGTDAFTIEVNDGYGWSNATAFNIITRGPNRAPVITTSNRVVGTGERVPIANWFSVNDPDGDAVVRYRFYDDNDANGYFTLRGARREARTSIEIDAADLGDMRYFTGVIVDSPETLWVQAFDGQAWSEWKSMVVSPLTSVPTSYEFGTSYPTQFLNTSGKAVLAGGNNDTFVVSTPDSYQWLRDRYGSEQYEIRESARNSLTIIHDPQRGGFAPDRLTLELSSWRAGRMAAAWVDNLHLLIADLDTDRYVLLVNFRAGESRLEMRSTLQQSIFVDADSVGTNLIPANSPLPAENIPYYWLDSRFMTTTTSSALGFAAGTFTTGVEELAVRADFFRAFPDFLQSGLGEQTFDRRSGQGNGPVTLSDGTFRAPDNTTRHVLFGRDGSQTLRAYEDVSMGTVNGRPSYIVYFKAVTALLGGPGADDYRLGTSAVVIETGDSAGDTVSLSRSSSITAFQFNSTSAAIIEGRHLWLRTDTSSVLLIDWEVDRNRIENLYIFAQDGGPTLSYSFDRLKALIDSGNPARYSWESLGYSPADWNATIERLVAREAQLVANRTPAVTALDTTVSATDHPLITNLFGATDPDGNTISRFRLTLASTNAQVPFDERGYLEFDGVRVNSDTLEITAAQLGSVRFAPRNHANNEYVLGVSAFDGVDWSDVHDIAIVTTGGVNRAPVAAAPPWPERFVGAGSGSRVISYFRPQQGDVTRVNWSDADWDLIQRVEVRDNDPSQGTAWISAIGDASNTPLHTIAFDPRNIADGYVLHQNPNVLIVDSFSIRGFDGVAWSEWTDASTVTLPVDGAQDISPMFGADRVTRINGMTLGQTYAFDDWVGRLDGSDIYEIPVWANGQSGQPHIAVSGATNSLRVELSRYNSILGIVEPISSGTPDANGMLTLDWNLPILTNTGPWVRVYWNGPADNNFASGSSYHLELSITAPA